MELMQKIRINKNRGWRGLSEAVLFNPDTKEKITMIFSFSQPVWDDMLDGRMVFQDEINYYVVEFNGLDKLPNADQQRSVLIKNFISDITNVFTYEKNDWTRSTSGTHYNCIYHFLKNRNNHTTSDWNCIGIRVVPMI